MRSDHRHEGVVPADRRDDQQVPVTMTMNLYGAA
jgi:hypothetical protein